MLFRRIRNRLRAWSQRDEEARLVREEMELHRELRGRKLFQEGLPPGDARFAAQRQFGNLRLFEDQISEMWGWAMWERWIQDFRHGTRTLAQTAGFTTVAVLTLALGLGINAAIFSAVNAVMLRPLPYPRADRLVSLWEENTAPREQVFSSRGAQSGSAGPPGRTTVSVANIHDYAGVFDSLASYDLAPLNLTGIGPPERISGEAVTWNFFSVLGISPSRGRAFLPEEDKSGANRVAIITDGFWKRRLGGSEDALGQSTLLDGNPYRIVGILPEGFESPLQIGLKTPTEVYVTASYPAELLAQRGDHEVNVIARLNPNASVGSARAALRVISENLGRQYPNTNRRIRASIAPLRDDIASSAKQPLLSLLGASGLIVLIACVNVANLLMVRATGRRHESSVRLALGARRGDLVRQLLTESGLIALAGCVVGIAFGAALLIGLKAIAPVGIPRIEAAAMDWPVFCGAAALAIVTAMLFGLAPSWHASQVQPIGALRAVGSSRHGAAQARWRAALTIAEIALSLVLLVGAGLLLRSFSTLMGVDLGFQPDHVVAMNINLPSSRYPDGIARFHFFERLEPRLRALPGIQSVAYANRMPMRGGWSSGIFLDGNSANMLTPDFQAVNPGYFETLAIPLLRGRALTPQDTGSSVPVAVVNLAFARQYLDGRDPIGHWMRRGPTAPKVVIVGEVNDIRRAGKASDLKPEVYLAAAQIQLYPVPLADLAIRTTGDPHALVKAISNEVWAIDKDQPVTNVRTMDEIIDLAVSERRFQTLLLLIFAAVAVALAMIGIYGVLAYAVTQRTSEIGIRVALGASPSLILQLILREAGMLMAAGIAVGIVGAFALTRFLQSLLFHVKPSDWRAYTAATVLLAAAGLLAALIPARRGARIDPLAALRQD